MFLVGRPMLYIVHRVTCYLSPRGRYWGRSSSFVTEADACAAYMCCCITSQILLAIERRPAFRGYNKRRKDLLRRAALRRRHFEDTKVRCRALPRVDL